MTNSTLKYFIVFLVTMAVIKALRGTAVRAGLIDHPGGRKRHEGTIPLIGGPAMFAGFGFGSLILLDSLFPYRAMFAAMGLLIVIGVLDDLHDLEPFKKLLAQIVAALFMTSWGLISISQLGDLFGFGPVALREWSIPFTVICVLGIINAINMTDGIDGLAGSLALVGTVFLGAAAMMLEHIASGSLLFVMAAAIAGFLVFNARFTKSNRARIFMGDSGSMMLGLFLTWFSVELTQRGDLKLPPIVAVWFLAVPILDMGLVTVKRLSKGINPFQAGRDHLHHVLLVSGYSVSQTVGIMLTISIAMAGIGFISWRTNVPDVVLFYGFMGLFLAYYLVSLRIRKVVRLLKRMHRA